MPHQPYLASVVEEDSRMFPFTLSLLLAVLQAEPRLDIHAYPLPGGPVARLGTLRYRCPPWGPMLGFTSTPKAIVFAKQRELVFLDVATDKSTTHSLTALLDADNTGG